MKQKVSLLLLIVFIFTITTQDILFAHSVKAPPPRYKLAIIPFTVKGRVSGNPSVRLAERLKQELERFNIFAIKNIAEAQSMLRANRIIPTNCASVECAMQAGLILGVQLIANGSVRKVGTLFFLNIQIVHIGSGQIVQSVKEDFEGSLEELIDYMKVIATRLVGKRPSAKKQAESLQKSQPTKEQQVPTVKEKEPTQKQPETPERTEPIQEDDLVIGGEDITPMIKPKVKKSSGTKWALLGLLLAGGVGAGIYFASKSGNNADSFTTLPGPPDFQ